MEEVEDRLPDMSAAELQEELKFWKGREHLMWGASDKALRKMDS
ncbi:MAG: hypothetical protein WCJ09_02455 [Planctomycetota bacterium]